MRFKVNNIIIQIKYSLRVTTNGYPIKNANVKNSQEVFYT